MSDASVRAVLIVEDDHAAQFLMKNYLTELGFAPEICSNGLECIEKMAASPERYAAIFMDVHMPLLKGSDAIGMVRAILDERKIEMPIIALSNDVMWHQEEIWRDLGFDVSVQKALSLEKVTSALEQAGLMP